MEKIAADKLSVAQARGDALSKLEIIITHKAGDEGKLFGSVGTQTIADAMTAAGAKVDKNEVRLPEGVIRHIGEYEIDINVHTDVVVTVPVKVVAE